MGAYVYDGYSTKNRRELNMDSLLLKEREIEGGPIYLMVVCDGVGSMSEGAYAASMAVNLLGDWLDRETSTQGIGLRLQNCVLEINRIILKQARQHSIQTATTLSALLLVNGRYYIVHAGDSRIYGCRDGILWQLTHDHTSGGKLTSCIGKVEQPDIFYNEGDSQGILFLICSDGLYKRMDMTYLKQELETVRKKHIKKTIERLVNYVTECGESDNISISILMRER